MKSVFTKISFSAVLTLSGLTGQSATSVDNGFGTIKIDEKIEVLQKFLLKSTDLWDTEATEIGEFITSGWIFDHVKAGVIDFHGLAIKRIEVYFNPSETEDDGEDVYCFSIRMDKITDEDALFAFTDKLTAAYGESMLVTSPFGDVLIGMGWFGETTILDVNFGVNEETGEELPYYTASFNQAYGG